MEENKTTTTEEEQVIVSYKGFKKDMTCRGKQYKEGETYEEPDAVQCKNGMHACEYPLDCFLYYNPAESVFHVVEQSGKISKTDDDSKVSSTKMKIGAKLDIAGIVKAAIEYTMEKVKPEAKSYECYGASSATGNCGASSATGEYGASSATGNCGASSATGYKSRSEAKDPCAIAVAWGYRGMVKGVLGSYLVLAEWDGDDRNYWTQDKWTLKGAKMEQVDGEKIKPDTWYTLINGEFTEVNK